jgi:hypothetical protein
LYRVPKRRTDCQEIQMPDSNSAAQRLMLAEALRNLRNAIDLLDRASAPGHIGAHVDLAMHELNCAIAALPGAEPVASMERGSRS